MEFMTHFDAVKTEIQQVFENTFKSLPDALIESLKICYYNVVMLRKKLTDAFREKQIDCDAIERVCDGL